MMSETAIHDGSPSPSAPSPSAPSPSALRVAALRALHQTLDAPAIFVDPLALPILGPDGAALVESYRASAGETARLRGTLAARHVVAEAIVDAAVARGVRQCVILGAGLDTYAYRQRHAGLRLFELDHPATQAWKRGLLRDAAIEMPADLHYIAMDLERDDLLAALAAAGFEAAQPAVFVMLGVVSYLARDTVLRLLSAVGRGADAEIVLDYTEPFENGAPAVRAAYEAVAARLAAGGEPWITLFEPGDLHATLAARGFAEVRDLSAKALQRRFCAGRSDGLTIAALVHLLHARTQIAG